MIKHVFLDLDDTILDFHASEKVALAQAMEKLGVKVDEAMSERYSVINRAQWERLEKGLATRDQILTDRFAVFLSEIGCSVDPKAVRDLYESRLSETCIFIDGAKDLLDTLYGKYSLYLASNGTEHVQKRRLEISGIPKYFKEIFISQSIGHNKPSVEFFEYCFSKIGNVCKSETIIIGDSPSSDILGGINAGMLTCRYNPHNKKSDVTADYEVSTLAEIPSLLERI